MKVGVEDATHGSRGADSLSGSGEGSAAPPLIADYPGVEADTRRSPGGWEPRTKALFLVAAGVAAWALVFIAWQAFS